MSNHAFNRDNHEAWAHQKNVEEAKNGAKQINPRKTIEQQKMQMKTSEKRKWHHAKQNWKLVRIKAAPHEGWEDETMRWRRRQRALRGGTEAEEEAPRLRRRRRGLGEGEGEGEENLREKWYPRVNISLEIPNFNSRDILRLLGAPNWHSIWSNFTKFSSKFTQAQTGGYYFSWKVPTDVIWATYYVSLHLLTDVVSLGFSNFEFLLFSVFSTSVMSGNFHRIWSVTSSLS